MTSVTSATSVPRRSIAHPGATAAVLTLVAALLVALLPPASAQAQTPPYDRGIVNACNATMRGFSPFSDVGQGTHQGAIQCSAYFGITQGRSASLSGHRFDPGGRVTRGQMASFIARMVNRVDGYRLPGLPAQAFRDSVGTHGRNIDRLAAVGIVEGRADGNFHPDAIVNRAQMATFIARAIEEVSGRELSTATVFNDASIPFVHVDSVNKLGNVGVVAGRGGGSYGGTTPVTRAQMTSFIARGLDYLAVSGRSLTPEPVEFRQELGSFTTSMTAGQPRNHNIRLGADYLDGARIAPGNRLSLNAAIGQRTTARGFRPNGFISDGTVISVVGGGVSQIATTFFNAAWFSGIELVTHRPHSIYFTRYPPGREATISWNSIDTVVRNDTPFPITVRTSSTATSLTVRFIGTPWGRTTRSWTDGPSNPRDGQAFSVRYGRTVVYPNGTSSSDSFSHRYNAG
jgi:hypothetical protein